MESGKANGKNYVLLKYLMITFVLVMCSAIDLPANLNNKIILIIRHNRIDTAFH